MTTREDWLTRIRRHHGAGEYLLAYDEATTATAEHPDDLLLQHQTVLALARTGATDRALEVLESSELESKAAGVSAGLQEDIAALRARLAKDRALSASGTGASGAGARPPSTTKRPIDDSVGRIPA